MEPGEVPPTNDGDAGRAFFCNTKAGELIISHSPADAAAGDVIDLLAGGGVEHVSYIHSMADRLKSMDISLAPTFEYQLHLIGVPPGEESWKANYLQFLYTRMLGERLRQGISLQFAAALGRSDLGFIVQPNHLLRINAGARVAAQPKVESRKFQFSEVHQQYRSMLNVPGLNPAGPPVRIAVLDTGVASDFGRVSGQFDFTDPQRSHSAVDDHGHGTVMCRIIADTAPFAQLTIFKVAGADGITVEWDALAALCALGDAEIVNMSLSFGLQDVTCGECGRASNLSRALTFSHASRSAVFENLVHQAAASGRLIVAAAGNEGKAALDYPARFNDALAISSITSRCRRSSFSNYGNLNAAGSPHANRFAMPGGETGVPAEFIGSFGDSTANMAGSSHAAAYATGVAAHLMQRARASHPNGTAILPALRAAADQSFPGYNTLEHGSGILRL